MITASGANAGRRGVYILPPNKSGITKTKDKLTPMLQRFPAEMKSFQQSFLIGQAKDSTSMAGTKEMRTGRGALAATGTKGYRKPKPDPVKSILTKRGGKRGLGGAFIFNIAKAAKGVAWVFVRDQGTKTPTNVYAAILASKRKAWNPLLRALEKVRRKSRKTFQKKMKQMLTPK